MIDDDYNELDDVDFTPSQEQIERAKPDIEFLKHCGLAHDLDDAWILQDLESYIMCIETLCNRVGLNFGIYMSKDGWELRVSHRVKHQGALIPIERREKMNPNFQKGIRELASIIYCIWGNGNDTTK